MVAALQAFCDESGIDKQAKFCVVSGFVGTSSEWQRLESRWFEVSNGVRFHGRKFFARDPDGGRVGAYKGWDDDRAQEYLDGLLSLIEERNLTAIGLVLDVDVFNALPDADRHYLTGAMYNSKRRTFPFGGARRKPYFVGFQLCIEQALRCINKSGMQVDFFFDQQSEYAPYATKFFSWIKANASDKEVRDGLGLIAYMDSECVGALQAADLLSNVAFGHGYQKELADPLFADAYARLSRLRKNWVAYGNKEYLERYFSMSIPSEIRKSWKLKGSV